MRQWKLRRQRSLIETVETAPLNWVTPLEEEAAPGFGTGTEIEGHGQENTEDACLFSNSADLDKTYESCSPYCDKPCQIHFNLDETGSDNNDDTTGNK